jgi:hypothetical protein
MLKTATKVCLLKSLLVIPVVLVIIGTGSCGKPAPIPAYIHIDSVALHTIPSLDGTNSHAIPDAWVYVDNQLVGDFELPATIPVPNTGQHTLQIAGGIKENGSSAERQPYPFYQTWSIPVNLIPETRITVSPLVSYIPSCRPFDWKEDFEGVGTSLIDTLAPTDSKFIKDSVNKFEGHYGGSAYLNPSANPAQMHFECESATAFPRPPLGLDVYLEINFKCNNKFYLGLLDVTNYHTIIYETFLPTPVWKKMYVRLTDVMSGIQPGEYYRIYFGMDADPAVSNPEMHIDNIKLIH